MKVSLMALSICVALFSGSPMSIAATASHQIDTDLLKKNVSNIRLQERQVMSSIFEINKRMQKVSKSRTHLQDKLHNTTAKAEMLAVKINQIETDLQEQKVHILSGLQSHYFLNRMQSFRGFLHATSPQKIERLLRGLKTFAKRDHELFTRYKASHDELLEKRAKLEKQVASLIKMRLSLKDKEQKLQQDQLTKKNHLSQVQTRLKLKSDELSRFNKKLGETYESFSGQSIADFKGDLVLPVDGPIQRGFGLLPPLEDGIRFVHKGLFFGSEKGQEVRVPFRGQVSFAGLIPGFGPSVVVDHGDHFFTVYGQIISQVQNGQEVQQGQTLGQVGLADPFRGQGLYFEIRHFSDPVDPQPWFKMASVSRQ